MGGGGKVGDGTAGVEAGVVGDQTRAPAMVAVPADLDDILPGYGVMHSIMEGRKAYLRPRPPLPAATSDDLEDPDPEWEVPDEKMETVTVKGLPVLARTRRSEARIVRKWATANNLDVSLYVGEKRLTGEGRRVRAELAARHPLIRNREEEAWHSKRRDASKLIHGMRNMHAAQRWLSAFDPEVIGFLAEHGFEDRCWHLVCAWMRVPAMREMMAGNPALAWLLASSWNVRDVPVERPMRSLRALAPKPVKASLAWLGLPATDGVLHLLRRVHIPDLNAPRIWVLKRVLAEGPKNRWLHDLDGPLRMEALMVLARRQPVSFPILGAINRGEKIADGGGDVQSVVSAYRDTYMMARRLGDDALTRRLGAVRTKRSLWALHEECVRLTNLDRGRGKASGWSVPIPPPCHPPGWLQPLTLPDELDQEAREMHHCVSIYDRRIMSGNYYVFACHHPADRATLGLEKQVDGTWRIDQLRGVANRAVAGEVMQDVQRWFHQAPGGPYAGGEDDLFGEDPF